MDEIDRHDAEVENLRRQTPKGRYVTVCLDGYTLTTWWEKHDVVRQRGEPATQDTRAHRAEAAR